jgi:hypothetical protein
MLLPRLPRGGAFAKATQMDWFGPVVFEAGLAVLAVLLLLGLRRLLK